MLFTFRDVKIGDAPLLSSGLYLVLLHIDKVPPHLALMQDGRYFSTSVKGISLDTPAFKIFRTIELKSIPSLFIKIKNVPGADLMGVFSAFGALQENETCLSPIKDFFSPSLPGKLKEAKTVFDLLALLKVTGMTESVYHMNAGSFLSGNNIQIQTYRVEEVYRRISELKNQ